MVVYCLLFAQGLGALVRSYLSLLYGSLHGVEIMWIVSHLIGGAGNSIRRSAVVWALRGGTLRLCDNSD